jgi:preprotein translocase subunit SecA
MVTRSIENAQKKVEGHNFDIRKHLLDFDNVMNQQRTIVYGMRKNILNNKDLDRTILDMLSDVTSVLLDSFVPQGSKKETWNLEGLNTALSQQFGLKIDFTSLPTVDEEKVTNLVSAAVKDVFERQKNTLGSLLGQIEKMVLLQSIDQRWKEHLNVIDKVKEGINLRGYAQKDPIVEYKKEAFRAFENLMQMIKGDAIEKLLKIQIVSQDQADQMRNMLQGPDLDELEFHGAEEDDGGSAFKNLQAPVQAQAPTNGGSQNAMANRMRPQPQADRQMNRAERRRLEKGKR